MLRWIDTHNHLFVLSEEQQKKEVWEASRVGVVSSLVCAGGVDNLKDARRRAAFIRFTSDLPGKTI